MCLTKVNICLHGSPGRLFTQFFYAWLVNLIERTTLGAKDGCQVFVRVPTHKSLITALIRKLCPGFRLFPSYLFSSGLGLRKKRDRS